MTKVISTINLKGGVGKTSTTIALAEFLVTEHNKKVLLIDLDDFVATLTNSYFVKGEKYYLYLIENKYITRCNKVDQDPQTNATVVLIGEDRWIEKNNRGETLLQLFKDKLEKTKLFNIDNAIEKNISNINGGILDLDLLPSSLGLIEVQDSLALISAGNFHVSSPVTILKDKISNKLKDYDIVIIDCPPNLGIITLNGLFISDYYIIPCIPDNMSTYGIPQILNRIKNFGEEIERVVEPLGIIVSMYRKTKLHNTVISLLEEKEKSNQYPKIFRNRIPLRVKIAEAADYDNHHTNTLKQKYGSEIRGVCKNIQGIGA
ncbi:MAG: putative AAA domain containing protein [Streblomastix strix]|uniref:Putative AAA domain containing protein n=1 Tax=Streblomastix strix TaxID=222440 RepID=A0A5J4TI59_9EUKA|nr:MAG: putative AAA domain containing protein [Streblomastix strix]